MRKFSSYGPIDTDLHFYVPRSELIEQTYRLLCGEESQKEAPYGTK